MSTPNLLVVVGKGGVGRTTVTAGLALEAGRAGKRVLMVELNGVWDIGRRLGHGRSFKPIRVAPNVDWRSLTTRECMESFARRKLKLGIVGKTVMGSRPMQAFVDAVPGLSDLLQLGKIDNILNEPMDGDPRYDLVVVDAPATGHGITLLSAPQSMTDISGSGPFYELARVIAEQLSSDRTGVVVATLPEALPLSETLGLLDQLAESPTPAHQIVVNKVTAPPVPNPAEWATVREALSGDGDLERLAQLTDGLMSVYAEEQGVLETLHATAKRREIRVRTIPRLPPAEVDPRAVAEALEAS